MNSALSLEIGGFVPFTTIDYPGRLSAIVFCQGCPWRCTYCHNPHLQAFRSGAITWSHVLAQVRERVGFLDAVVFSGGEPTAQRGLAQAIREIKQLGVLVGLHTAGVYPARLAELIPLVNWIGFDVKAPLDSRYDRVTGFRSSAVVVRQSLSLLLGAGVPHQFRTTLDPAHLDDLARKDLASQLQEMGASPTSWQVMR